MPLRIVGIWLLAVFLCGSFRAASAQTAMPASPVLSPMTPEQARIFPFTPPLAVDEAIVLLRRVRDQLETAKGESPPNDTRIAQINRALQDVIAFTRQQDDRLVTLDKYDWYKIGTARVSPGPPETVEIRVEEAVPRATAIAFRAENGRALAEQLNVFTADDKLALSFRQPRYLQEDVPRRELYFLLRPVDLEGLEVRLSTDEATRATIHVYAGVSPIEEHGKRALYFMEEAWKRLAEYKLDETQQLLRDAETALFDFKRYHQL